MQPEEGTTVDGDKPGRGQSTMSVDTQKQGGLETPTGGVPRRRGRGKQCDGDDNLHDKGEDDEHGVCSITHEEHRGDWDGKKSTKGAFSYHLQEP